MSFRVEATKSIPEDKEDFKYLYHFTHISHLESIKQNGLLSRDELESNGYFSSYFGGNDLSRDLDKRRNIGDKVRLSFTSQYPMLYKRLAEGNGPYYLLMIDKNILKNYQGQITICDRNATDNYAVFYNSVEEGLKHLDFNAINSNLYELQELEYAKHQAEVLIDKVPVEYIINLDSPIELTSPDDFSKIRSCIDLFEEDS